MKNNNFDITNKGDIICISKDNEHINIMQAVDDDIWFSTNKDEINIKLYASSFDYNEWETYLLFEDLIKRIIGRYVLYDLEHKDLNGLPDNFINLEKKEIIWITDSEPTSYLKLHSDNGFISISLKKTNDKSYISNSVRIRTNGSSYSNYYHEFIKFYKELKRHSKKIEQQKIYKKTIKHN